MSYPGRRGARPAVRTAGEYGGGGAGEERSKKSALREKTEPGNLLMEHCIKRKCKF